MHMYMHGYKGRRSANVCPAGQDLSKVGEFFNNFIFKMLPHQYSVVGMSLYCFTLLNTITVGSLIFKRLCDESGVHMRLNFIRQNLWYFVSFKGIPFTYTNIPSPCSNRLKKCFSMTKWKNVKQHLNGLHPSQNQYSEMGAGAVDLINCGETYIVEFVHQHTRGLTMSSSNVYLIKF